MLDTVSREPALPIQSDYGYSEKQSGGPYRLAIAAAVILGFLVRAIHAVPKDFPLNDGGLFYAMVHDLQHAHYLIPPLTSYNAAGIPFAYPPLSFYIAGLLSKSTPLSLFDVFRFLPLIVSSLTVMALFLLAQSMLSSRRSIAVSVFVFALIPRSFIWLLMGGGVARSFGLLFAILALQQAYLLYTRRSWAFAAPAAILSALTILSHAETGWFLAFSIAIFFVARGRHRHGILSSMAVATTTLLLTAPWWATVFARHGIEPFLAANGTGGSIFSDSSTRNSILLSILRLVSTSEPFYPLLGTLALLGLVAALATRRFLLPAWWLLTIILDARAFPTFITLPVAMLAGIGVTEVLLPAVETLTTGNRWWTQPQPRSNGHHRPGYWPEWLAGRRASTALLGIILCYGVGCALVTKSGLAGEGSALVSLSNDERAAMHLVAQQTLPSSRFLLVTGANDWETDKTAEWFPVLAQRQSIATVQGYEWTTSKTFADRVDAYDAAHQCGYRFSTCLNDWSAKWRVPFNYVYIPRSPGGQCCWTLVASLGGDSSYTRIYDGPGATIFVRHQATDAGAGRN
ncbi:MAG: hypothetical protein ACR2PL_03135 [Dehalococcoidia bacterium]